MPYESVRYFLRNIVFPGQAASQLDSKPPNKGAKNAINELRIRYRYMAGLAAVIFLYVLFFVAPPIPQPQGYHSFADKRRTFGIPYFFNVISNAGFLWAGYNGLTRLAKISTGDLPNKKMYTLFFLFAFIGGIGSAIYHMFPNNMTLFLDRLPMIVAIMSLFSAITSEIVSIDMGRRILMPMIGFGVASTIYWEGSELFGRGDLRAYGLANFLPVILLPLMLLRTQNPPVDNVHLWRMVLCVGVARITEMLDWAIFQLTFHYVSGHTIKHILLFWAACEVLLHLHNKVTAKNTQEEKTVENLTRPEIKEKEKKVE